MLLLMIQQKNGCVLCWTTWMGWLIAFAVASARNYPGTGFRLLWLPEGLWHRIDHAEAEIYLGECVVTDAAYVLLDALGNARDLQLPKKVARIQDLHNRAVTIEPGNEQLAQLAKSLITPTL